MTRQWHKWIFIFLAIYPLWAGQATYATDKQNIQLVASIFDPVIDGEPNIPPTLQAAANTPYALLQLVGPMQTNWATDFQALGVIFYGYVPDYAYLVRLANGNQTAVANYPAVRWLGAYHPAYKISPTVTDGRLFLQLFPDAGMSGVVTAVALTGAPILEQNEAAHLLIVEGTADLVPALAQIEAIYWIQNVAQMQELNDDARWVSQANVLYSSPLYERGLRGNGQVGAVSDSGLAVYDFGHGQAPSCFFVDDGNNGSGGTPLLPDVNHRKVLAYSNPPGAIGDNMDGSGHGSHVVGSIVGDQPPWNELSPADGQAYEARIYFQDIGLGPGLINPPSDYRVMFSEAYDPNGDGAYQPDSEPRTHSNSWGSAEAIYSVEAMQIDDFMWTHPDYLIFYAAGNQGPAASTIGQPATAKNIVTVGATENGLADPNSLGYFSSHGPAPFGRMKPTITAPGDRITSALAGDPCGTTEKTGTSMATPTVHGLTLLMRQYLWDGYYPTGVANPADHIHPSAALLKAMLINSGRPLDGMHTDNLTGGSWPSNGQGWGRVAANDVLYFQGDHRALWLHDEVALDGSAGFDAAGQTRSFHITVSDGAPFATEPLEITLAWSDYPGLPPAGGSLVNNLDLTVTGPDGVVHIGNDPDSNDFNGLPDLPAVSPDLINPWEVVYLANPQPGEYTITVTAGNIASTVLDGARKQGFSLVVTGDLQGDTRAEIEYAIYEADGVDPVRLRVSDAATNGDSAMVEVITAVLTSSTNPANINITLTETDANSGIFAGQITLGDLAVTGGESLQLSYQGTTDTATVAKRPLNFTNPPQLAQIENGEGNNQFSLTWQPAESSDNLAGYTIQQATHYVVSLTDDAEGALTDNWTTGQIPLLVEWTSDDQYQQSGTHSYWSGRGDTFVQIDVPLTLRHDVTIPTTVTSARLGFYSRYFNDFNDYGHVEISANGGAWTRLRRLYADPRVASLDGRLQYHEFDLSNYIGTPIRIRFRYDNGVVSLPPDSPGWWLDDITISGGVWQTLATTGPEASSYVASVAATGQYFYRVRGLYNDGTVTGWSNVMDTTVTIIAPPPDGEEDGNKTTGGGWLVATNGQKLNFGFHVRKTADDLTGNLQLNDKATNNKITITDISSLEAINDSCGSIVTGPNALEFQGSGTFNGSGAGFRVCVQDNDEPGQGSDLFYLACVSGCSYNTGGQTADDIIDGGNIQVYQAEESSNNGGGNSSNTASTLILDPILQTEGLPGQLQLFTVMAYDANQDALADAPIILTRVTADGQSQSWTLLTDLEGTAIFSVINVGQTAEYTAAAGNVTSNAIALQPLLP